MNKGMRWNETMELTRVHLDIGCGGNKQKGFIGMDKRDLLGVDIVQDLESFPWPLSENSCEVVIASHFVEHLNPKIMIDFMDEVWRILVPGGTFAIAVPYAGSRGYWQDPTHCNGCNEVTWQYFDPKYPLYGIYSPRPWSIKEGFPVYQVQGNLEVILEKMDLENGELVQKTSTGTLGVSVAENANTDERVGG